MKKFVLKASLFLGVSLVLLLTINFIVSRQIESQTHIKVPSDKSCLVIGHSIPACAYNDTIIKNMFNVSGQMEGYFYTYYKLSKILGSNRNVKEVYIEFTNGQLDPYAIHRIYGDYLEPLLTKYAPVIDGEGLFYLFSKSPGTTISSFHKSMRKNFALVIEAQHDLLNEEEWGGYYPLFQGMSKSMKDSLKKISMNVVPPKEELQKIICEDNLRYLDKAIELCRNKGVKVKFIRTPQPSYEVIIREKQMKELLSTRYAGIPFIDLKVPGLNDDDYADNQHLSYEGSKKVSRYLNELIESEVKN